MIFMLLKRALLILVGPFIFLFVAFVPALCGHRPGFRGWFWRTVSRSCSWLLWLLSIRVEISDADRKALAADTNSIIVANHRSHLDGFSLLHVIPDEKWVTFGAKKELCRAALLRRGFTGAGLLEIDRAKGKHALDSLTDAVQDMPARRSPILFAEGTRARAAGLSPFKAGAVLIAQATNRVVRPIVIIGSDTLLARGAFWPRKGTIRIRVLPPVTLDPTMTADQCNVVLRAKMAAVYDAETGELTAK
jgi:1-acyl-sn-glycerol-3-phosphate acyltransferase